MKNIFKQDEEEGFNETIDKVIDISLFTITIIVIAVFGYILYCF